MQRQFTSLERKALSLQKFRRALGLTPDVCRDRQGKTFVCSTFEKILIEPLDDYGAVIAYADIIAEHEPSEFVAIYQDDLLWMLCT